MPFEKGKSGNPGGRPKLANEAKELAQQHGYEAIKRLADLIHDDDKRVSVAACQALLDRAYGKPSQAIAVAGDPNNSTPIPSRIELVAMDDSRKG